MNTFNGFLGLSRVLVIGIVIAAGVAAIGTARAAQGTCEASDYGITPQAADNTAALKKALTACAGKTIHLPQGIYVFSPNGYDNGLFVTDGTGIAGDGADGATQTIMRVGNTGNFASLLWVRDVSNVAIQGIRFEGTPYDSGCGRHLTYGKAITVYSGAKASAGVENVRITNNTFHNFNGQSWINVNAEEGSPGIGLHSEIQIANNGFFSDNQIRESCAETGGIGRPIFMIWLHGSDLSGQGMVENVSISSNTFHADYVYGAVVTWSDTSRISIQFNTIVNAGRQLPQPPRTELGRYAIAVYDSAHEKPGKWPDNISIVGNTIVNPVSCGIYVAAARNLDISRNTISGQSDRFDDQLPKGAIALNHAEGVRSVQGNKLLNNYIGISVVAGDVVINDNQITPAPGGMRMKTHRDAHSPAEIVR